MKKLTTKEIIKLLKKSKSIIGKERDALGELLDEMEGLYNATDEAVQDLENAIDRLSDSV